MNENINVDKKEKDDFLDEREKFNPVGTKILVEVEVIRDNGFTELTASMFNKNKSKEFEDLLGVKINKIYRKDITIPDDDVQTLLERVLDKIKQHKADGYSI